MRVNEAVRGFTEADAAGYRLAVERCVRVPVDDAFLRVTGDDRKGWLQGQASNDLRQIREGGSLRFCFCQPTGQIVAPAKLWAMPDAFYLAVPRATLPAVLNRFETMVVMEDVAVEDVSGSHRRISLQGPAAAELLGANLPPLDCGEVAIGETRALAFRANRTGLGGWDVWFPTDRPAGFLKLERKVPPLSPAPLEALRLEAGIPTWGRDVAATILPPEMGPAFEQRHVSYTKGCYTGQEVLMRIHARGHTNRTWRGLVTDEPLIPGEKLAHPERPDAGEVTSVAFSPELGWIAGAMLRNVVQPGQKVWADRDGRRLRAEVREMPLLGP
ncbi:MAG: aminomethyltransferase family protein [Fimbriimonadaceae bacterium]|nr:aminomethyltransferase family protein [Fimbriimonadaceae bacterium]